MASIIRKISAVVLGAVVFIGLIFWSMWVGYVVVRPFIPIGVSGTITGMGYSQNSVFYLKDHDIYTSLGFVILSLAGGLASAMLVWNGSVPKKIGLVLMTLSLLVLLPMSAANYAGGDAFSTRSVQAIVNLPMVFFGVMATLSLYDLRLSSRMASILRLFAATFIVMQGILIPLFYSTLWWLNFQNAIALAATRELTPGWISALSGLAGFVFGICKFLKEERVVDNAPKQTLWMPGDPK